jgi:hypothetical protein
MRRRNAGGCEDCIVFYFRSYDYAGRCKIYGITDLLQFIVKSTKWNCTTLFTSILHFRTAVCTVLHICGQMTNLSNYHQCRFIHPQDWSRTSLSTDAYSGSWRMQAAGRGLTAGIRLLHRFILKDQLLLWDCIVYYFRPHASRRRRIDSGKCDDGIVVLPLRSRDDVDVLPLHLGQSSNHLLSPPRGKICPFL